MAALTCMRVEKLECVRARMTKQPGWVIAQFSGLDAVFAVERF